MVRASEVEGRTLTGPDGSVFGTLDRLLLHPDGSAIVMGAAVRPPAVLVVVGRPQTFIALAGLNIAADGVSTTLVKLLKGREAAEAFGSNPDRTIIWTGMPVAGPGDAAMGIVSDFEFDPVTGAVLAVLVAGGVVANAAHGALSAPAEAIMGYSAGAVHLCRGPEELDATGGLAKTAAAAAVRATGAVSAASEMAGDAVVSASGAAGRAIKAAKDAQIGERAARTAGKTWRDTVDAFRDGMKDD